MHCDETLLLDRETNPKQQDVTRYCKANVDVDKSLGGVAHNLAFANYQFHRRESRMYRLVTWLCQPYTLVLVAMALWLVCAWRKDVANRRRLLWMGTCWAALVVLSLPVITFIAAKSLEFPYPPTNPALPPGRADTVVVLTGGVDSPNQLRPYPELSESSIYRCLRAAQMYDSGGGCKVLVAGGKVDPQKPGVVCSDVMRDFLEQLGVDKANLSVEGRSRTTYESAVACKTLLRSHAGSRIFLVTDAIHLRRAIACFSAEGIEVVPVGCHYRATDFEWKLSMFLPSASALSKLHPIVHEWVGLTWYWFRGRI